MVWEATETLRKIVNTKKKIVVSRGGTRSGKTYAMLQALAIWLFTGQIRAHEKIPKGVASVVRKHKTTVASTVMRDFDEILSQNNLSTKLKINKQTRTYEFKGRMVEFIGADDYTKLMGSKRKILYVNEATEIGFRKEFFQLLIRTGGPVFLDLNPHDPYTWVRTELEEKRNLQRGDVDVIVTTYKDNRFLEPSLVEEIEYLQQTDTELWKVYGLGHYGKVEGLVYTDYEVIEQMPEIAELEFVRGGLDFGFTNSATALVYCGFKEPNLLFVDEKIYKYGLTDSLLLQELKAINHPPRMHISGDSAQAGTISELQSKRYNVHPVKKVGMGAVNSRIFMTSLVKNCKLFVTASSQNLIRELRTYKYQQTVQGDWLNEPSKGMDHALDAIGYFALTNLRSRAPKKERRVFGTID